jgi:hypothetical protein
MVLLLANGSIALDVHGHGVYYHTNMVAPTECTFALTCISVYQNATNHHLQPENGDR